MQDETGRSTQRKKLYLVIGIAAGLYTLTHLLYSGFYYPFLYLKGYGDYFRHLGPVLQFLEEGRVEGEMWYGPLHYLFALPVLHFFPGSFGSVFYFIDLFCIFGAVFFTCKTLSDDLELKPCFIVAVIWLNSSPLYYALGMRSVELYELFCLSLTFYLYNKGKAVQAAAWLALAVGFKYLPGIFLVYLLVNRQFKPIGALTAVLLFIYGISGLVFGNGYGFGSLLDLTQRTSAHIWWPNQSIGGIMERFLTDYDFVRYGYYNHPLRAGYKYIDLAENLLRLSSLVPLFWILCRKKGLQTAFRRNLEFSILLCYLLFLSPITWEHYGIFTLFAYSLLALSLSGTGEGIKATPFNAALGLSYLLAHYFLPKTLLRTLPVLKPGLDNTIAPQFYCTAALGWFLLLVLLFYAHSRHLSGKRV